MTYRLAEFISALRRRRARRRNLRDERYVCAAGDADAAGAAGIADAGAAGAADASPDGAADPEAAGAAAGTAAEGEATFVGISTTLPGSCHFP